MDVITYTYSNRIQVVYLSAHVILKFDGWPEKQQGASSVLSKLCASFHSHQRIQTGVTVWKRSIWVKIGDFLSQVTLKFDG